MISQQVDIAGYNQAIEDIIKELITKGRKKQGGKNLN